MKKLMVFIQKSLSNRLSLWIVFFAMVVFIAAFGFMFNEARRVVREEAISRATQILENTVLRVNTILNRVEIAANNTDWLPVRHLDAPDSMYVYSRRILQNNPDLDGCSIAFEPDYFKQYGRGRYFSAHTTRDHETLVTIQEGDDSYEYFYMDWYQLCKLLNKPCWTEPYIDHHTSELIASYCKPMKDSDDNYVGTFSVDISLSWFSNTISAVKPYPNSYCVMIGRGGTYFIHPDPNKQFYQTIFTETLDHPDPELTAFGTAMKLREEGMRQMKFEGEDCYVFYRPISTTGWSLAIVCPESDIFGGYNRLQRIVLCIVLVGLLLLLFIFSRIIKRELEPLKTLALQAEVIASGEFDKTLPDDGRIDEIGQLSQSFSNMQRSLVRYVEELKLTTAQKASFESELKVASDIQMGMVPRIFPPFPNRRDIDLYASMTPAKEVGGDLYDYFVQDEYLYFCIGDVSGKGIPASLFMAITRNMFRIIAQQSRVPEEIAKQMNQFLAKDNDQGMFVTMFIGVADLRTGHLDFCNCGHNAPVVDGKFLKMKYVNQPLGLWEDDPFYGESIDDIRGRQLMIYTDGLNEAENPQQELLGNKRLLELMSDTANMTSEEVINMLKEAVEAHRAGTDPNDDLTLLCLKIKEIEK